MVTQTFSWSNEIATSHDLTTNGGKGNPRISGKSRLVIYYRFWFGNSSNLPMIFGGRVERSFYSGEEAKINMTRVFDVPV